MNESFPIKPPSKPPAKGASKPSKEERLKAALRDNLKRRKQAARKTVDD
ncbi:hypothetical protein [Candidatus Phycosocius bacilliformis]|nr:hypothetical protein [Candidatus Phycosocius bacilliformis]